MLPAGAGWLLVEFGGETIEEANDKARRMIDELAQGAGETPSALLLDDPARAKRIWKVRESALGATAVVPGRGHAHEGWEDAAVPPAHRLDQPGPGQQIDDLEDILLGNLEPLGKLRDLDQLIAGARAVDQDSNGMAGGLGEPHFGMPPGAERSSEAHLARYLNALQCPVNSDHPPAAEASALRACNRKPQAETLTPVGWLR